MADFEPPSFSLGLDFEPPSFSLGLDFDIDSEPQSTVAPPPPQFSRPPPPVSSLPTIGEADDDDDFDSPTTAPDSEDSDPPRSFKRLRRGPTSIPDPEAHKRTFAESSRNVYDDDDIEDFSSQDDEPSDHPKHYGSVCSSSKFPLQGRRIFSSQSASRCTARKSKEVSNVSTISQNMETSTNNFVFPKLTVSPLRRFQLIDSDSEEPSISEVMEKESEHVDSPLGDGQHDHCAASSYQRKSDPSAGKSQARDLWKDFCSENSFNIPTPALDEVCEEYFKSVKDRNGTQATNSGFTETIMRQPESLLPAHRYFFHNDPRIQKLVRDRLPNFFPLGAENVPGDRQNNASVIDYMGQFGHEGSSRKIAETSARKRGKNVKQPNSSEVSQGSQKWVDPKNCAGIPKDAGRRRVQAVGTSAGHWYTNGDGKKVYVSKNGKELTGQGAYRFYRKESGAGFKKSRKKTTAKRKAASKKK